MKAVVLAGGQGARLRPYTLMLPKPLVPVGDWPILEVILRQLAYFGVTEVYLTLGHLGHLIRTYLEHRSRDDLGVDLHYFDESRPMGTAGSLAELAHELDDTFIVTNGDVLTSLDFRAFQDFHRSAGAEVTVAVTRRDVEVSLGVLDLDGGGTQVLGYREKPRMSYHASMGIYVFQPSAIDCIIPGEPTDLPTVVNRLLTQRRPVAGYLTDCYWRDIGTPADYSLAAEEFQQLKDEWPWLSRLPRDEAPSR